MSDFFNFPYYGDTDRIGDDREAQRASARAGKAEQQSAELLQRHERMALVCQALLELVQERTGITDEELEAKIMEVDQRDGKVDGKIGAQVLNCPKCSRKVNSRRPVCIFCGTRVKGDHSF